MKAVISLAALLAAASFALAQTSQPGAAAPATQSADNAQKEFVHDAASGNNLEIQTGQFVAQHSQNAQVKALANMLITDHKRAQELLRQAAENAGVTVDDTLTPLHKAMLDELQKKSGKDLDREFAFSAIADHHKDILEYSYASRNLANPFLKQYASVSLATLQKHLHMADTLAGAIASVHDTSAADER
jgi:putative membrane protein